MPTEPDGRPAPFDPSEYLSGTFKLDPADYEGMRPKVTAGSYIAAVVEQSKPLTEADLRAAWDSLNARAYKPHSHVTWPNGTYCLDCGAPVRTTP